MTGSDKDKPRPKGRWLVGPQVFEPGDFFLAHSDGPMGGPIRWAETSPWEEPTEVNHTGGDHPGRLDRDRRSGRGPV